jgi:ABC-type transport system involved in multi-copper enzyme maturation permease subunit
MSLLGLLQIGRIGVLGYERTVISLLNVVQYLVPLLGLLLGHDLIVGEYEERTLRPVLAGGVSRRTFLIGKWFGGCLSLAMPLLLGFAMAGCVIGLATKDHAITPFLRLAVSGLMLGIVFLTIGLTISTFARTRVQSLVFALLTWCVAVFAFDLVALGCLVSAKSRVAARELEVVCDATHVNGAADIHAGFDNPAERNQRATKSHTPASLGWLAVNPVDLFRATNLATQLDIQIPSLTNALAFVSWLALTLGASFWRFRHIDL